MSSGDDNEMRMGLVFSGNEAPDSLILRQLRGMRRDFEAMLERQTRTIELVNRLSLRMDERFDAVERDIRELRSDIITLENKTLNNDQEMLRILRRLEEGPEVDREE